MFSVMWSEHCSYKSSRRHLRTLPTGGERRRRRAGRERRRHRHRRRAARSRSRSSRTTTRARSSRTRAPRPASAASCATSSRWARGRSRSSMRSRFGDPTDARTAPPGRRRRARRRRLRQLRRRADGRRRARLRPDATPSNPLVNVMAIGAARGAPADAGSGARTRQPRGALRLDDRARRDRRRERAGQRDLRPTTSASKRPSVQVGDPFAEKLLIEASLELIERGLVGGPPGPRRRRASPARRRRPPDRGRDRDRRRPRRRSRRRETGPGAVRGHDHRSRQERMCAIVAPAIGSTPCARCARDGACRRRSSAVSQAMGLIQVVSGDAELAAIPASALTSDAIVFDRLATPPPRPAPRPRPALRASPATACRSGAWIRGRAAGPARRPEPGSRAWVTTQYDETVGTDTVAGRRTGGAASCASRARRKALVATTDAQAAVAAHDPWLGAAMAVAECARNVAITGARPLGVTNCLNFGDPTDAEAFWRLRRVGARARRRLPGAWACRSPAATSASTTPRRRDRIPPTAQIGIVGLLDDVERRVSPAFRQEGDADRPRRRGVARARGLGLRRHWPAPRPTTGRRPSTWRARRRSRTGSSWRLAASLARLGPGRLRRRPGRGARGVRHLVGPRRPAPGRHRLDAIGRPLRREPRPCRGDRRPGLVEALRPGARASACPSGGSAWSAASG